jgi:3-dehydroquinate synthase
MNTIESLGYSVYFDESLSSLYTFLKEKKYSKVLLLVDRNTSEYCLPLFQELLPELVDYDIIEVDPGEENKNIDFCIGIWKMMLDFGADRQSVLINLGGGVITDMGGFAASTFKRGIDFIQVPTTLLSQVDASVGGKTGIDMDHVKNLIGTFTQPQAVFICSRFLQTLDARQRVSGFAEMLKHGLIADAAYFEMLQNTTVEDLTIEAVQHSVGIKNRVVLEDPTEKGLRKILNFGHTIGHAVESYSLSHDEQPMLHGEAIAVGMVCEAFLSQQITDLSPEEVATIGQAIASVFPLTTIPIERIPSLLDLMRTDKKNTHDQIGFALLKQIGQCEHGHYASTDAIEKAIHSYNQWLLTQIS